MERKKFLGEGAFGTTVLWEYESEDGEPVPATKHIVVKETIVRKDDEGAD
jgi:hypothetical protein